MRAQHGDGTGIEAFQSIPGRRALIVTHMPSPDQRTSMIGDLVQDLRAEASASNERRVVVLAGEQSATYQAASDALEAANVSPNERAIVGTTTEIAGENLPIERAGELIGTTRTAIVLDCHDQFRPNALGRTVGAVDGGGLYVLCTPPLNEWPDRRGPFDEWLAVPPFGVDDVTGNFKRRMASLLRVHPGIAIIDVDAGHAERDGLTWPAPRIEPTAPALPDDHEFPVEAYESCLTADQVETVAAFESLRTPGEAVVVEADRGRGKSAAAGLAGASLALDGKDVLVTAPQYRSASEVFTRADSLLETLDAVDFRDRTENPHCLETAGGVIRFVPPGDASGLPGDPDVVIVDEAAAFPVRRLESFLEAPAVAFTTTIHGYEGAGRGFSVRFRARLEERRDSVTDRTMTTPIRYAAADPVESWAFRTLLLDARPAVDPLVADAEPETVRYEHLRTAQLLSDEHRLREAFGLLVLAHYRTEPDDLARVLDAPNVAARALLHDGHVVSVALLAREGDLPPDRRKAMYNGERIRGNMIPDVLTTQLRDEAAGIPVGQRILRIATHPAARSRGLGSKLLGEIAVEFADGIDWLGTGFGATPELVSFWRENGFRTVHLSTTRNDASGEHSAIMLAPCSASGRALANRHTDWFHRRIESVLTDALRDVDPDVIRAVLRSVDRTPELSLSEWEWRLVAGVPRGAATIDTAPGSFRRLVLRYLADGDLSDRLDPREERVLVRTVLQAHDWEDVGEEFGYVSTAECKRAAGRAIGTLVETLGTTYARAERGDTDG